jgi:hypothetical protein
VEKTVQTEYEYRLVSHRLGRYEKGSRIMRLAITVFAPTSAVTGLLAWADAIPTVKAVIDWVWQFAAWFTVALVVPLSTWLEPTMEKLRGIATELQKHVSCFRTVLDAANYQDTDAAEWLRMAEDATRKCSAFVFHEEFSDAEMNMAWDSVIASYSQYFE